MIHTECLICAAVTKDVWLCQNHYQTLRDMLYRLPALARDLETTVEKLDHMGTTVGSSGKGGAEPSILNFDASNVLTDLRDCLRYWVRKTRPDHVQMNPVGTLSNTFMAGFLRGKLPTLLPTQPIGAMYQQVVEVLVKATKVIDTAPTMADLKYVGPCGAVFDNGTCPSQLWATYGTQFMTCRRCGTMWDVADRRDHALRAAENLLATADAISRALTAQDMHVTANMIYLWKVRDRIRVAGTNKADQPLYRVGDVMDLLMKAPNVKGHRS